MSEQQYKMYSSFKLKNRSGEPFVKTSGANSLNKNTNQLKTYPISSPSSVPPSSSPKSFPNMNIFDNSCWCVVPEEVFLQILYYLTHKDVLNVGLCCKRWNTISKDDFLWKKMFHRDFKIDIHISIKPGTYIYITFINITSINIIYVPLYYFL